MGFGINFSEKGNICETGQLRVFMVSTLQLKLELSWELKRPREPKTTIHQGAPGPVLLTSNHLTLPKKSLPFQICWENS
jgi:hypothetical protein